MGYTIEVSFNIRIQPDVENFKSLLAEKAESCGCESKYFMHEIEGRGRIINRNHCVFVAIFDTDNYTNSLSFLRKMRQQKNVYIECVYKEDGIYNLIHASPKYLQRMDRDFVREYKKKRKKSILSEDEIVIKKIISNK